MSDQTTHPEDLSDDLNEAVEPEVRTSAQDIGRLKRIGSWHATAVAAAIGIWGSTNQWALSSDLLIAQLTSLGLAFAAATVMASIIHEWGHFAGAKLSGSIAPVLKKPARFYFMFNFDMENNSSDQFLAMSLGGIIANWALVVLMLVLIPLTNFGAAFLVAVLVAKAVNVSFFEVPIVMQVRNGEDPQTALTTRLEEYGLKQLPGYILGALTFLALT